MSLARLQKAIGYQFNDESLLDQAVTHRSKSKSNNERLEFLGDSLLNCVVAESLFRASPKASEGDLSRIRATLVNKEALVVVAKQLNLGEYMRLGSGELKSGGFRRDSILADSVEAIIGATYLDSDFATTKSLIERLWGERLVELPNAERLKDPKTRLQEYLQSRKQPLPEYEVLSTSGKEHEQTFVVECRAEGVKIAANGAGLGRRRAEQAAATEVLKQLGLEN